MAGIGWGISLAAAFPQLFVFHLNDTNGRCENIFRETKKSARAAYLTYALVLSFLIPLFILAVCYARIFLKISQKAAESNTNRRQTFKPGKVHLQSTPSSSLPKAKIKTLKMTFVIVSTFIFFGLPYFIAEMIMSYGDHRVLNEYLYAVLGAVAPAPSSINPYVFLLFNANWRCLAGLSNSLPWSNAVHDRRRYIYSNTSLRTEFTSVNSDIVRSSMYKPAIVDKDTVEMYTLQ